MTPRTDIVRDKSDYLEPLANARPLDMQEPVGVQLEQGAAADLPRMTFTQLGRRVNRPGID